MSFRVEAQSALSVQGGRGHVLPWLERGYLARLSKQFKGAYYIFFLTFDVSNLADINIFTFQRS